MNNKRFLSQFEKSRRDVAKWPKWMQDLAYVAAATFPTSNAAKNKRGAK
jgi:hypothetical protein